MREQRVTTLNTPPASPDQPGQKNISNLADVARTTLLEIQSAYPYLTNGIEIKKLSLEPSAGLTEEFVNNAIARGLVLPEDDRKFGIRRLGLSDVALLFIIKQNPTIKTLAGESVQWEESLAKAARCVIVAEMDKIKESSKKRLGWRPKWM